MELKSLIALVEHRHPQDVAGQKIRGELNTLEIRGHRTRQRFCQRGFAGARHILEEHMPTGGNGREQLAYGPTRTFYDLGDVVTDEGVHFTGVGCGIDTGGGGLGHDEAKYIRARELGRQCGLLNRPRSSVLIRVGV